jgi:methyl-accepting chemotaxis protein
MRSIGVKLFASFVCCIVLAVGAVGFASYVISADAVKKQAAQSATTAVGQTGDKLELWFRFYEQLVKQIAGDPDIGSRLAAMATSGDHKTRLEAGQTISDKLNSYTYANPGISALYLLPEAEGGRSISTVTFSFTEEQRNSDWYRHIWASGSQTIWMPVAAAGQTGVAKEPVFTLARKVDAAATGGQSMVLLIELKAALIDDLLAELLDSGAGRALLADSEERVFADTQEDGLGARYETGETAETVAAEYRQEAGGSEQLVVQRRMPGVGWQLVSMTPVSVLLEAVDKLFRMTLIVAALSLGLAGAAGYLLSRMISKPIVKLSRLMKLSGEGDLTGRIPTRRKDEIGQLGDGYNEMMDKLSALVGRTRGSADRLNEHALSLSLSSKQTESSAQEIATATEHIAQGASNLAVEAERGMLQAQGIEESMRQVEESSQAMERSAEEVLSVSARGTQYMRELAGKTGEAEAIVRSLAVRAARFEESASHIRGILEMLENLSKQTNILALNASIESARSTGETGRGFSVIADEIRMLAQHSKGSIDEAGRVTDAVEREAGETGALLAEAQPLFLAQLEAAKQSEAIFEEVSRRMDGFRGQLADMAAVRAELAEAQRTLGDAIGEVGATSEQSSAYSEQVASLGAEQLKVSANLVELADRLTEVSKDLQQSLAAIAAKY